jgi:hypothetical protein
MFIALLLTLLISRELKIRTLVCCDGSYWTNSNTPLAISPSIFLVWDCLNGSPGVVIVPSFLSLTESSMLACSLFVINVIQIFVSFKLH